MLKPFCHLGGLSGEENIESLDDQLHRIVGIVLAEEREPSSPFMVAMFSPIRTATPARSPDNVTTHSEAVLSPLERLRMLHAAVPDQAGHQRHAFIETTTVAIA